MFNARLKDLLDDTLEWDDVGTAVLAPPAALPAEPLGLPLADDAELPAWLAPLCDDAKKFDEEEEGEEDELDELDEDEDEEGEEDEDDEFEDSDEFEDEEDSFLEDSDDEDELEDDLDDDDDEDF